MDIAAWHIEMDYIEACNCDFGCPCNFNGYPTDGKCETMAGYHIRNGRYGDTSLDGMNMVMAASWPGAIHQGNGTVRLHLDRSSSEEQRNAVMMIFSGQAKGDGPFELFSKTFSTVEEPLIVDIEMHVDGRNSWYKIDGVLDVQLEPFTNPVSGATQDIQVHMPAGFIFQTALAAKTRVMKLLGFGPLSYDNTGQNAFVAQVSYAGP
jgi:hypothetical protein